MEGAMRSVFNGRIREERKRSWVGVEEEKPYAYLREQMVSSLMEGIVNPQSVGMTPET
jgi:hypothetical protein